MMQLQVANAAVGQAEEFDEFKAEDLNNFHDDLVKEEQNTQLDKMKAMEEAIPKDETGRPQSSQEMELLKAELLEIPKRDRVKIELYGDYAFDTNINRFPPQHEKNESTFNSLGQLLFDLSGRKTDLRSEWGCGRQWNIEFPISDFNEVNSRLRYRRKYFKKLNQSIQGKITRNSSKTPEINQKRVRYDFNEQTSLNYTLTRRMAINWDSQWMQRRFPDDPFDSDSFWQVTTAPSIFWNFTPKSRVSLGYSYGENRIRSKSGDANSQNVQMSYFGQITRKSAGSFDLSYSHQSPKSRDTSTVNTYTAGMGYMYQWRPKTQFLFQIFRQMQDTTQTLVAGTEFDTTKVDTHYTNSSFTISMNQILSRKLTSNIMCSAAYMQTTTKKGTNKDNELKEFSFPFTWNLNYLITRWLRLNLTYTFTYRLGAKHKQDYRDQILKAALTLPF